MSKKLVNISVFITFLFGTLSLNAQNLGNIPKTELIKLMVDSFENQICNYYSINKENSDEAFFKYVNDFNSNKINIKDLTSKEELELLKVSNETLKEYIWITDKEKFERFIKNIEEEEQIQITEIKDERNSTEPLYTNKLGVNYSGEYSSKLLKETKVNDLKEVLTTLRDTPDTSPRSSAFAFTYINKESYKDSSLKTFISFELYYTVLNTLNKNE
ncbi:hypothetical protein [Tenacibaculum discolor]|uniref:hypothetical protein n=1 Tax=Tenacibaculum discolor TaxID=361581 RepID=UPI003F79BE02